MITCNESVLWTNDSKVFIEVNLFTEMKQLKILFLDTRMLILQTPMAVHHAGHYFTHNHGK